MKHRGKSLAPVLVGILIGCTLSGPAVHAAAEAISACRSSHAVCVDGNGVEMEAYVLLTFTVYSINRFRAPDSEGM